MPFKRILVPLDSSSLAEEAIAHAVAVARDTAAEIHLLHVQKSPSRTDDHCADPVDWRLRRAELRSYMNRLSQNISNTGHGADGREITITQAIVEGRPAEQIVEYCEHHDIDLIVLTAYGKGGVSRFDFGSTAHKVLSAAGRSCLIVRPGQAPVGADTSYRKVLVSMDGSPRSEWVACQVASLMRGQKAEILLLQVIAIPEMPRRMPITREEHATREKFVECNRRAGEAYLEEIARQLQNGIKVHSRLLVAQNVAECVYATAAEEGADLIAISAHDWQTGGQQGTGAICQTVLCRSARPVLVFQDLPESQLQSLRSGADVFKIKNSINDHNSTAHQ
ncbi:universal stress protein [Microbulbifer pacificus]|uniref:universal stress protein n=1 Tax=Microbulbifer pacificus TaxID=407164 RepID=UPI000CF3AC06|nr:universal stress protein [Microbulbifer pacificus]